MEASNIITSNVKEEEIEDGEIPLTHPSIEPSFKGKLNISNFNFALQPEIKPNIKNESLSQSPFKIPSPSHASSSKTLAIPIAKVTKRKASSQSSSSSPKKRTTGYAPPSTYSHLPELRDIIVPNLICIFIGLNPGITTASSGHAYAHPSNHFWKLLHSSGCTPRRCSPTEDGNLPALFSLGNTNIVSRPTRNGSELSKSEMDESVHVLEEKIGRFKPEAVCIVGKSIWESIWRVRKGRKIKKEEFRYGWQEERWCAERNGGWEGARVFVATTTSALAATMSMSEKEGIWRQLGEWVEQRRVERSLEVESVKLEVVKVESLE